MSCYSQWTECSEISAVTEGKEREWYDDKEDGLLMNMPAKEEGGIRGQCQGGEEGLIGWVGE